MRIGPKAAFRVANADFLQQLHDPRPDRRAAQALMQFQTFRQLLFDGVQGVQAGHRLLEDEADVVAPDLSQRAFRFAHHLRVAIGDRPGDLGRVTQKAHRRQSRHRLARPAFADQRNGFALFDVERHAPHRADHPAILTEGDRQVLDLQHAHPKVFRGSKASRTPSKMNTRSDSMIAKVKKAVKARCGACRFCCACRASCPSDGASAGRPKPI